MHDIYKDMTANIAQIDNSLHTPEQRPADRDFDEELLTVREIAQLLKSPQTNGALAASIDAGQTLLSEAQAQIENLPPNRYVDALAGLADALREMLEQFRN